MVKGKSWDPVTLKAVGGTEGVGVTFLEETFTASSAPPQAHSRCSAGELGGACAISGNTRSVKS